MKAERKIKTIRRLMENPVITDSEEPKMVTIWECIGKDGTHSRDVFWMFNKPVIGGQVLACSMLDGADPYEHRITFRYWNRVRTYKVLRLEWDDCEKRYFIFLARM